MQRLGEIMSWNFRGSLSRVDFLSNAHIALPFSGCAWLKQPGNTSPVLDAGLELVARDDLRIRAIQDEVAEAAERLGVQAPPVTGCLYRLDDVLHFLAGVEAASMALIQATLLPALVEGRLHLTATVDFAGFAEEESAATKLGVTRRAFANGEKAIYFDACNLSVNFNAWGTDASQARTADQLLAVGGDMPRF